MLKLAKWLTFGSGLLFVQPSKLRVMTVGWLLTAEEYGGKALFIKSTSLLLSRSLAPPSSDHHAHLNYKLQLTQYPQSASLMKQHTFNWSKNSKDNVALAKQQTWLTVRTSSNWRYICSQIMPVNLAASHYQTGVIQLSGKCSSLWKSWKSTFTTSLFFTE